MFKERLTCFLLHHKYIEFDPVLFHNIVIVEFLSQRLQSASRGRRLLVFGWLMIQEQKGRASQFSRA